MNVTADDEIVLGMCGGCEAQIHLLFVTAFMAEIKGERTSDVIYCEKTGVS